MPEPQRLHEIYIRQNTPTWLRNHARAMFRPEECIPSFDDFSNDESDLEWSEYEDLLFLPVLAHFLSQVPRFSGPPLVVLTLQLNERARLFPDLLNLLREQKMSLPCDHLVGVSLDLEDVPDINAYTTEAAQRAERIAAIFQQDFSTPEKTAMIGAKLTDQEAVDVFLYSLIETENAFNLPRPAWAIQQAQKAMEEVDSLWNNGLPDAQGQRTSSEHYEPKSPSGNEPAEYMFMILTEKSSGENAELLRTNMNDGTSSMRVAGKWGEFVPGDYWKQNYDFHALNATPQQRAHILDLFDSQEHRSTDLSDYFLVPGKPRKIETLTNQDLENYLNAEVIFADCNGIECRTAPVGAQKQVWSSFDLALGSDVGEIWVFRADVLLPQASNQRDDDVTLAFFADEISRFGLIPQSVQVKTFQDKIVPAVMVPVPRNKLSKNLATEIVITAIMTGRLGIYHFAGTQMTTYTSSAIGYTGKRSFQIVMA